MEIVILMGAGVLLAGIAVVAVRRFSKGQKSYEDVVDTDIARAMGRVTELRKWSRVLRTYPEATNVFILAGTVAGAIEQLLQRIKTNPDDRMNTGLTLPAIHNVVQEVQILAENIGSWTPEVRVEELKKAEASLKEAEQAFTAKRAELAEPHLVRLAGNREAQKYKLGTGQSAEDLVGPGTVETQPQPRKAQAQ